MCLARVNLFGCGLPPNLSGRLSRRSMPDQRSQVHRGVCGTRPAFERGLQQQPANLAHPPDDAAHADLPRDQARARARWLGRFGEERVREREISQKKTKRKDQIARVVRFFRSLRTLVFSIVNTLKSLFWAMLLLAMIMYVFGAFSAWYSAHQAWSQVEKKKTRGCVGASHASYTH